MHTYRKSHAGPLDVQTLPDRLALLASAGATTPPPRDLARPHLGQRDPEIASVPGRTHPTLGTVDGLYLRGREHEKVMGLAGLPADAYPILGPRRFPDTTDPSVRDAYTVARPYLPLHQSPAVFASSAARRFFSARSCSQRAVTSRTIAAGPSIVPVGS